MDVCISQNTRVQKDITIINFFIQGVQECSIPKMQNFKIFTTIKTIEFGILIYLRDRAVPVGFLENFESRELTE